MLASHPNNAPLTAENCNTSASPSPGPDASQGVSASQGIRDAVLRMHRARLARIVRGVVIASSLVCVAGLGRAAIGSVQSAEADEVGPRIGAVLRDATGAVATLHVHLDSLSKRTHAALRAEERRASKGSHGASRRFEW